jgi:hypothetical protein
VAEDRAKNPMNIKDSIVHLLRSSRSKAAVT